MAEQQEINPYQAPSSEVSDPIVTDMVIAGKGRRFGTFIVDYAGFNVVGFCMGILVYLVGGDAAGAALQRAPQLLVGIFVVFTYYAFFESLWARTPGKLLFGTKVVNEDDGGRPSIGQVLVRTACRFIPFEALSCFGERAWHDGIPKTYVVLAKPRS